MPEGRDTDRQGGARIDRNTGTYVDPEAHEEFDDSVDYGQRVTAFGDIDQDLSEDASGYWDDDRDQLALDMMRGEDFDDGDNPGYIKDPSNVYARKSTS